MASDPTATMKTVEITAQSEGPRRTHVDAEHHEFVIGENASPLDYLLGSLAGCLNIIGHLVARERDIAIDGMEITADGELDTAKYKGKSTASRAGFQSVHVHVAVETDADEATVREWFEAVEDRCPVADHLEQSTDLSASVELT